jgi:hypothetical protein
MGGPKVAFTVRHEKDRVADMAARVPGVRPHTVGAAASPWNRSFRRMLVENDMKVLHLSL